MQRSQESGQGAERVAIGLGLFSIGLGVAELVAPAAMARLIGVREDDSTDRLMRTYGARELGNGLAILVQPDKPAWLWSRVAGDVVDLSTLGSAMTGDEADGRRLTAAALAVVGVTALDVLAARWLGEANENRQTTSARGVRVEQVVTINRSIEEVYAFWRRFENLPKFMRHLESVQVIDGRRSRWRAKAPAGTTVQWEAEIVQERENEWIAWQTVEGSGVRNSGSVRFSRAPGARGTELRVQIEYVPPAGALGRGIAFLFGEEPEQQIREDLFRFKQLMETGEVMLSDGPGMWRPARPAKRAADIRRYAGVER